MKIKSISLLLMLLFIGNSALAQKKYLSTGSETAIVKKYNSNEFSSKQTFAENIMHAPEFEVLSKLFNAADLKQKIESQEGVTVFAMLDASFAKLSSEEKKTLFNDQKLMKDMVYHLAVPGRIDSNGLKEAVKKRGGTALLATIQGESLKLTEKNGELYLHDNNNNSARIVGTDYFHKNGLFHIIDGMLWLDPKE